MLRWYKKHFHFRYIGVVHLPVAVSEQGRMTASKPVLLMMTESGRRKAVATNRGKLKGRMKELFDHYFEQSIDPWLHGGAFPKGEYMQDILAELLVKIIDNKLEGREKFHG
jgi:hypothetical protein